MERRVGRWPRRPRWSPFGHLDGANAETELAVKAILIASQRIEQAFLRMPKDARWIWRAALAGIPRSCNPWQTGKHARPRAADEPISRPYDDGLVCHAWPPTWQTGKQARPKHWQSHFGSRRSSASDGSVCVRQRTAIHHSDPHAITADAEPAAGRMIRKPRPSSSACRSTTSAQAGRAFRTDFARPHVT